MTPADLRLISDSRIGHEPRTRRESLPTEDVRLRMDQAIRRGWLMIGRRALRLAILVASDTMATVVGGTLAFALASLTNPMLRSASVAWMQLLLTLLIFQPFALGVVGTYTPGRIHVRPGRILVGVVLSAAIIWLQARLLFGVDVGLDLLTFSTFVISTSAFVGLGRSGVDRCVTAAYRNGLGLRRVLVVGTADDAAKVSDSLLRRDVADMRVEGFVSPGASAEVGAIGTLSELDSAMRAKGAKGVIVSSSLSFEIFETLVRHCFEHGASVYVVPRTLDRIHSTIELRQTRSGTLMKLYPQGLRLPQLAIKRAMDLAACGILCVLISPLLVLISLAIKIDSRGPVFFKQVRAGVGGRPFWMYKFRTMVADADEVKAKLQHLNESGDSRLFKIRNDPRVTRVGRWLRRTSLDELPQLFNVLRGEMSLVGPRPFFPTDLDGYEDHHFERLTVLPGITGLWQVSGRSDIVDFEEVVRLDTAYIQNWSIGRDLWILLKTLPAAFGRGGAY